MHWRGQDGPSQCAGALEGLAVSPLPLAHTRDGVVYRGLLGLPTRQIS